MERIAVVTDTGSNLSFEQAKELGIYWLPLQITIDETTYQDTLEISTQDIYNELAKGKMPKTSMAAYQKICDLFEELKKEPDYSDLENYTELEKIDFYFILNDLNYDERIAILLFYLEDYSIKDIAKILKSNENTIKTRLRRGKEKIKNKYIKGDDFYGYVR